MKVAILSLPLSFNVGGILQQYALKVAIQELGHEVLILSRRRNRTFISLLLAKLKWKAISLIPLLGKAPENKILGVESFKRRYLRERAADAYSSSRLRKQVLRFKCNSVIVGSDQVWNSKYSPDLLDYFLGFCNDIPLRKISYAASFGHASLSAPTDTIALLSKQLQLFDFVSVRENSAIQFCSKNLNRQSVALMPDPTVLLTKDHYANLVKSARLIPPTKNPYIFIYSLDVNPEIIKIAKDLQETTKYDIVFFDKGTASAIKSSLQYQSIDFPSESVKPTVESWLGCISNAQLVLTDSFHGSLFSCIFNTPFYTIGNHNRGMDRFVTLLSMLGLNELMINSEFVQSPLGPPSNIDWKSVNTLLDKLRSKGSEFLSTVLS